MVTATVGITVLLGGGVGVRRVQTTDGKVVITDKVQKFGNVEIQGQNTVIKDSDEVTKVLLTSGDIVSLDNVVGSPNSGESSSFTSYNLSAGIIEANTITVVPSSATLHIGGSFSLQASSIDLDVGASCGIRVTIVDALGAVVATVANHHINSLTLTQDNYTIPSNWGIRVGAGVYRTLIEVTKVSSTLGDDIITVSASDVQLSYSTSVERTEIGANGILSAWNTDNYEHTAWDGTAIKKSFKSSALDGWDTPNSALAGYYVHSNGGIYNACRYGAKIVNSSATYQGSGKYKVWHKIGHTNYTVNVTMKGSDDNWFGVWKLISYSTDHCIVKLAGLDSQPVQRDFMITFSGDNQPVR